MVEYPGLMRRIYEENKKIHPEMPGVFGSVDCTHFVKFMEKHARKNLTVTGHGNCAGRPSLSMEASCDQNLYFTSTGNVFGGATNDITMFKANSPIFQALTRNRMPSIPHDVLGGDDEGSGGGFTYNLPCFLGDGIYWGAGEGGYKATLMCAQADRDVLNGAEHHFKIIQESRRKEIERAFGCLKAKFSALRLGLRGFNNINCEK